MILYWLMRVATISRFVPLRVAYWGAVVAAELLWLVMRSTRTATIGNMTQVLGDPKAARVVGRRSFRNYCRYLVDFLRAPKIRG